MQMKVSATIHSLILTIVTFSIIVASEVASESKPPPAEKKAESLVRIEGSNTQEASADILSDSDILLQRVQEPFNGDLNQLRARRIIRVLVSHSKTNFFFDKGQPRGFEYELLNRYEKFLNKEIKDKTKHIKIIYIPKPFDHLIPALKAGKGDLVAAGLTITPSRKKQVDFTDLYLPNIHEIAVLNKSQMNIEQLVNLSGREVYVRPGSSYVEHLKKLNSRFKSEGKAPIKIIEGDPHLGTEDILEMVNAGVIGITVADHHIADAWSEILPNLQVRKDLKINTGGGIAWAVRKDNNQFKKHLNTFIKKNKKGSLLGNILFKRYYQNSKWIKNPLIAEERRKLERYQNLFEKYAEKYDFDWLAVVAQAYQESGHDNSKISPAGAIGIMQVLPSTAADKSVGIKNIKEIENNIHAGVKYLNFLRNRYFADPKISAEDKVYFAWAAYNAGPAKINRLRRKAAERGFDPNRWFNHVETIAAEEIGRETVDYVANINKYFVAYKLSFEANQKRKMQLENVGGAIE